MKAEHGLLRQGRDSGGLPSVTGSGLGHLISKA